MVAPNDEMRASIVLTHQCMEDGFSRPCIAHGGGKDAQDDAVRRIIVLQQHFIAAHAHIGGNIVALGISYQRMQVQAVDGLKRALLDIFMRAMNRIARLEAYNTLPATLEIG